MNAKAIWHEELTFTGSAGPGFTVPMGASTLDGGRADGFQPMELLLVGLAGCTGMAVVAILRSKKQHVTGLEVKVNADHATTYPMIFTKIRVKYVITGHQLDRGIITFAIEQASRKYCSAEAMLTEVTPFEHTYELIQAAEVV